MRQKLLDSIVRFAQTSDSVSALILIGSQARAERKADEFSDTDLILVVKDTEPFIRSDSWLDAIGAHHMSFTERTLDGQREKRVLFDGALDVDFVIMDEEAAQTALAKGEAALVMSRGYRMLVDKRRFEVPALAFAPPAPFVPADADGFRNTVHDFWYHTVWTTKKLLRGEIWATKFCMDGYLKSRLLWMIEQHEHAARRSGADTWYGGRFIDRWAREDILRDLQTAFAHYDPADIARALLETMKLFRRLALEVAAALGFAYPAHADEYATEWVLARLALLLPPNQKEE